MKCKNCGLEIVPGFEIEVKGGFICHPDCGAGRALVAVSNDTPPDQGSAEAGGE